MELATYQHAGNKIEINLHMAIWLMVVLLAIRIPAVPSLGYKTHRVISNI